MNELSLFDLLPEEEGAKYKPIKPDDWKWTFADYPKEKNGLKVFSCFACGCGSTMGYKLAGCEVVGCCEIDPRMNETYVKNHNPKHNFCMDIREFNKIPNEELPPELFDLDILDGSPPCTTFSMAGDREKSWGKQKKFREGQAEQTLDDLSFVFNDTVAKLKPKCVIIENVEGLIRGEAWSYVQRIYKQLNDIGYKVKHWLLKGEHMGVPQTRHRVFFIALRNDIAFDLEYLDMYFNYEPITYGEIKTESGDKITAKSVLELLPYVEYGDIFLRYACEKVKGKKSFFNEMILYDDRPVYTLRAKPSYYRYGTDESISKEDIIHAQTFPEDYDFVNYSKSNICYICGMSVPPVMIKRIVQRLIESGVFSYKEAMDK